MRTVIGRVATGFFPSVPPIVRLWSNTSAIRPSIIARSRFRRNTAVSWKNTASNMMNAMCGIELHFALSGLGMSWGIEPRAWPFGPRVAPWAIASCRVAASVSPNGAKGESPGQRPGYASPFHQALKGRNNRCLAPSGLGIFLAIEPRALPWAITVRPFGASTRPAQFAESAKREQAIKANLRGLGYGG